MERYPNSDFPLEEILWQKKHLVIPRVKLSKDFVRLHRSRSGVTTARIFGVDECHEKWILVRLSTLVDEAKQFIREEIEQDLDSMFPSNGQSCLTMAGLARYLGHGLLPKDIRVYLKEGITHLGLGIGIIAIKRGRYGKFYMDDLLGIWRPLQDINF